MKRLLSILLLAGIGLVSALNLDSQQIEVNGHSLHYYQIGTKGTPLILLTGYATTSNFWNSDFVECLATNHQVYLMDYAGVNSNESVNLQTLSIKSMALDVNEFGHKLKLKHPALVGWSMGGGVALEASFIDPQEYRKLYLIAPILPITKNQQLTFPTAEHGEFKSESDVLNYVFNNNLYNYESLNLTPLRTKFLATKVSELFPPLAFMPAQWLAISSWINSPDALNKFKMSSTPAVFFTPRNDKIINQKVAESIMQQYPKSKIELIEKSGHAVSWQFPLGMCQDID